MNQSVANSLMHFGKQLKRLKIFFIKKPFLIKANHAERVKS